MPSSPFRCCLSQQPIFQVYRCKRKMPAADDSLLDNEQTDVDMKSKRQCSGIMQSINSSKFFSTTPAEQVKLQNDNSDTQRSMQHQSGPMDQDMDYCNSENTINSQLQDSHSHTYRKIEPTNFTSNPESIKKMEAQTMEFSSAPDSSQHQQMVFCDQFCVGGELSPRSGLIRCYCNPSWEGLMEMRTYISDYY